MLTLIQGHRDARMQNFWTNYLAKFEMDLDGIW